MKNRFLKYIFLCFAVATTLLNGGCESDTKDSVGDDKLSIKVFYPTLVDVAQTISITGNAMADVVEVVFPGDVSVTDIKHVGHNQIDVVVPSGIQNGRIVVKTTSQSAESELELTVSAIKITQAYPSALQTGDIYTIKGKDLMCVKQIIFPDNVVVPAEMFIRKCVDEIKVAVPSGTINGQGNVSAVTASGAVVAVGSVDITVVLPPEPGGDKIVDLFDGSFDIGDWSNDLVVSNAPMAEVKAGVMLTVEFAMKDTWGSLKIKRSNTKNEVFDNSIPNGWGIDLKAGDTQFSCEITQGDLDAIATDAGGSLAVQGANAVIKKIYVTIPQPKSAVVFEGSLNLGDWSNTLTIPSTDFAQFKAGDLVTIEFTADGGQLKVCPDNTWSGFDNAQNTNWGGYDIAAGETSMTFAFTAADIINLASAANFAIQGKNAVITKITVTAQ